MEGALQSDSLFRAAYHKKLCAMLQSGSLADSAARLPNFILVCANAYTDREILNTLEVELRQAFEQLKADTSEIFASGQIVNERSSEDLLVFLKMALVGFDRLQVTEQKQIAWWRVQFNHLRSFRPQRSAARPVASIHMPFNEQAFYYELDLCERESFWSGALEGKRAYLLYNKYPFARLHALLVPEPTKRHPQFLSREHHHWAWNATQSLAQKLPGFGMGYNSLGTFASVNHLHFQTFIDPRGMPVTWEIWNHNGGSEPYPADCAVFDTPEASWSWIQQICAQDLFSYNLLYSPGRVYGFKRKRQGTYKHSRWTSGFAWYEMSGNLILYSRKDYAAITFERIEKEFRRLKSS
jgi:hypothetical protein